jgi:N-acetylneuraminic acid mutarotase
MSNARYGFKLLLLRDGRVLAMGDQWNVFDGDRGATIQGSESIGSLHADLWDPAANGWKTTSGLNLNRSNYAALVLRDGRVFVAGGTADDPLHCFSSTKLFDPDTETWRQAAGLNDWARCYPAYALLPDGRVLLAGGTDIRNKALSSTEIFDPTTEKWSKGPSMPSPRTNAQAVTLKSGKVLLVGGASSAGPATSALLYEPSSRSWRSAGSVSSGILVALQDGGALVLGQSCARLDAVSLSWRAVACMSQSRVSESVATLADGRVIVAGGETQGQVDASGVIVTTLTATVEIFDPATNKWLPAAPLPSARENAAAVLLQDGSVLVAGGDLGMQGAQTTPQGGHRIQEFLKTALRYWP